MAYAEALRRFFPTLHPTVEDLLLLEPHQVAGLPARAPVQAFATLLRVHPLIGSYLAARHPPIASWIAGLRAESAEGRRSLDPPDIADAEQRVLWELADEIAYQRAPDLYDEVARRDWDPRFLADVAPMEGRTVVDAGAGTGVVAFEAASRARLVYAVEPVAALRAWMREKARRLGVTNVYVVDGTLDAIPLPHGTADLLVTGRAIGWRLGDELQEIARVLRPGGCAVHLTGMSDPPPPHESLHEALLEAGYRMDAYGPPEAPRRRYALTTAHAHAALEPASAR